ncbi:LysR family transcriptional regulator [Rhizobium straminoryzae]|uniref:HTH-type transcriptional regulator TtuA n=1 Tax=Rhizobium straminoryzae TaxID=1387186 RepID=A0A549T256_9HYPH|nr:LysR family transcriptional regulator [Rhizobium straminoryzae]TRL35959.1 LysR family transcriptional regulator [Rhizobium straminoryzae]
MTFEQLRIFLVVAEQQHMTRAAEHLHLTQSSVSAAIAALEERHAVKLFNRVGRGIELTEAGRLFLPEARAVLERAADATRLLKDLSGAPAGHLLLHASQTVASYWLPSRLMRYRERYPQVALSMSVGNTRAATDAVLAGQADLAVVEGRVDQPALSVTRVGEDRLVLVVGRRHRWTKGQGLSPADLLQTAWIHREQGSGTRAALEEELRRLGIAPAALDVALELPSNEAVIAAVEAGTSAAVLSFRAVEAHLAQGRLRMPDFPMPTRPFFLLLHRERHVTRAMRAMIEILGEAAEPEQR